MTKQDTLTVTILADGTLKTETDRISGANHQSAESFLKMLGDFCGGAVSRKRKPGAHAHVHTHGGITHCH